MQVDVENGDFVWAQVKMVRWWSSRRECIKDEVREKVEIFAFNMKTTHLER